MILIKFFLTFLALLLPTNCAQEEHSTQNYPEINASIIKHVLNTSIITDDLLKRVSELSANTSRSYTIYSLIVKILNETVAKATFKPDDLIYKHIPEFDDFDLCVETFVVIIDLFVDTMKVDLNEVHNYLFERFYQFRDDSDTLNVFSDLETSLDENLETELALLEPTFTAIFSKINEYNWSIILINKKLKKRVAFELCNILQDEYKMDSIKISDLPAIYKILIKISIAKILGNQTMNFLRNSNTRETTVTTESVSNSNSSILIRAKRASFSEIFELTGRRKIKSKKHRNTKKPNSSNLITETLANLSLESIEEQPITKSVLRTVQTSTAMVQNQGINISEEQRTPQPLNEGSAEITKKRKTKQPRNSIKIKRSQLYKLLNLPIHSPREVTQTKRVVSFTKKTTSTIPTERSRWIMDSTPETKNLGSDSASGENSSTDDKDSNSKQTMNIMQPAWPHYGNIVQSGEKSYEDNAHEENRNILKVENGRRTLQKNEFPMIVKIKTITNKICTGTLVANLWILTTQRCVLDSPELTVYDPICNCNHMRAQKHIHPDEITLYEPPKDSFPSENHGFVKVVRKVDIALLKLDKIWSNQTKSFSLLPTQGYHDDLQKKFRTCMTVGFDETSNIGFHKETLPLLPMSRVCALSSTSCRYDVAHWSSTYTLYYAGGACKTDEGSPLFCWIGNQLVQYGVHNRPSKVCGMARSGYGRYTRVDQYLRWIKKMITD